MLDDLAAIHEHNRVGDGAGEPHFVRDDHHGHSVAGEVDHDVEHLLDHLGVEGARRLVEEHDLRLHAQGPRDGDALLLPAGELRGILVGLLGNADTAEKLQGDLARLVPRQLAHEPRRQHEIFNDCQVRKEVELLKHHADLALHGGDVLHVPRELGAGDHDAAGVVLLEPVDAPDQRGFSRA